MIADEDLVSAYPKELLIWQLAEHFVSVSGIWLYLGVLYLFTVTDGWVVARARCGLRIATTMATLVASTMWLCTAQWLSRGLRPECAVGWKDQRRVGHHSDVASARYRRG